MADVAARAGVSGQTVSRVVNGSPRVDPATRARVEQAMRDSGYRVHRAARALRTGRTGTIGAVVSTLATVGNSLMLEAVTEAAAKRGYDVALVTIGDSLPAAFARLRDQGVDGVVVVNEASTLAHAADLPSDLRFAVVDSPADDRYLRVETDHAGGAAAATRHLIELGHRAIAHIGGPAASYAAAERERGWRSALAAAGLDAPTVVRGEWSSESGRRALRELIERGEIGHGAASGATAVVVANDQMALGALRALAERGLGVPEDVSVVGFDDVADAANYLPPLTTVRQHFDELGERVVASLVGEAAGGILPAGSAGAAGSAGRAAAPSIVPATLVVRASTAPPAR